MIENMTIVHISYWLYKYCTFCMLLILTMLVWTFLARTDFWIVLSNWMSISLHSQSLQYFGSLQVSYHCHTRATIDKDSLLGPVDSSGLNPQSQNLAMEERTMKISTEGSLIGQIYQSILRYMMKFIDDSSNFFILPRIPMCCIHPTQLVQSLQTYSIDHLKKSLQLHGYIKDQKKFYA